jgi:hypothetical protein
MTLTTQPITISTNTGLDPGPRLIDGALINSILAQLNAGNAIINSGSVALTSVVTLTSAQVLALNTTPVNIIPAIPGALIMPETVTYFGTGAYTQAAGAGLRYHGLSINADAAANIPANPFINGTFLSSGVAALATAALLNVTTAIGIGVDFVALTTNPTVGTTPVRVTCQYNVIFP